jgi:vacuolar protein sorting-associated protein 13A/C
MEPYWAGDVVTGVGKGTHSLIVGLGRGVGGLVYEPYLGAQENGFVGMSFGIFKGIGGFFIRPLVGGFEFITQPLVGIINTPKCIYKKLT